MIRRQSQSSLELRKRLRSVIQSLKLLATVRQSETTIHPVSANTCRLPFPPKITKSSMPIFTTTFSKNPESSPDPKTNKIFTSFINLSPNYLSNTNSSTSSSTKTLNSSLSIILITSKITMEPKFSITLIPMSPSKKSPNPLSSSKIQIPTIFYVEF